jgi:hypothetical protein
MAAASKSITTPPSVPPPLPLVPARPAPTPPTPQHPSAETINGRFQLNRTIPHCGAVEMGWLMLLCCCTCLTVGMIICCGSRRVSDFGVYLEWLFQLYNEMIVDVDATRRNSTTRLQRDNSEMIVDGDATRRNLPLFVDAFFTTAPVRGCLLHNGTGASSEVAWTQHELFRSHSQARALPARVRVRGGHFALVRLDFRNGIGTSPFLRYFNLETGV